MHGNGNKWPQRASNSSAELGPLEGSLRARKLAGPASALVRFRLDWPPGDQCGSSLALIDLLSSGWQLGGRMNQPELGANSFEQVARSS